MLHCVDADRAMRRRGWQSNQPRPDLLPGERLLAPWNISRQEKKYLQAPNTHACYMMNHTYRQKHAVYRNVCCVSRKSQAASFGVQLLHAWTSLGIFGITLLCCFCDRKKEMQRGFRLRTFLRWNSSPKSRRPPAQGTVLCHLYPLYKPGILIPPLFTGMLNKMPWR